MITLTFECKNNPEINFEIEADDVDSALEAQVEKLNTDRGEDLLDVDDFELIDAEGSEDYEQELLALSDFKTKKGKLPDLEPVKRLAEFLAGARDEDSAAAALYALLNEIGLTDVEDAIAKADDVQLSRDNPEDYAKQFCEDVYDLREIPDFIKRNISWAGVAEDMRDDMTTFEFCGHDFILCNPNDF